MSIMSIKKYKFLSVMTMAIAMFSLVISILTCLRSRNYRRMCCNEFNKIQDPFNDSEINISEDINDIEEHKEDIHVHHDLKTEITEE